MAAASSVASVRTRPGFAHPRLTGEPSPATAVAMLRRIVLGAVTDLLRREVMRGAGEAIMKWLDPCVRLGVARVLHEKRRKLGHDVRAAFWGWRVDVLRRRCNALQVGGLCATDIAERAAVEAITEAISKGVWPK